MGCMHPRHCTSTHSTPTAGDTSPAWSPYGAGQLGADTRQRDDTPGLHIQSVFPLLSREGCSTIAAGDSDVCITTARHIPMQAWSVSAIWGGSSLMLPLAMLRSTTCGGSPVHHV